MPKDLRHWVEACGTMPKYLKKCSWWVASLLPSLQTYQSYSAHYIASLRSGGFILKFLFWSANHQTIFSCPAPAHMHKVFSPTHCRFQFIDHHLLLALIPTYQRTSPFLHYTSGMLCQFLACWLRTGFFTHKCHFGTLQHVLAHCWYSYVLMMLQWLCFSDTWLCIKTMYMKLQDMIQRKKHQNHSVLFERKYYCQRCIFKFFQCIVVKWNHNTPLAFLAINCSARRHLLLSNLIFRGRKKCYQKAYFKLIEQNSNDFRNVTQ